MRRVPWILLPFFFFFFTNSAFMVKKQLRHILIELLNHPRYFCLLKLFLDRIQPCLHSCTLLLESGYLTLRALNPSMVWDHQQIISVPIQIYAMFAATVLLYCYCTVLSIVVLNRSNMTPRPSYVTKAPETDAKWHCKNRLMKNTSCYFILIICIFFY